MRSAWHGVFPLCDQKRKSIQGIDGKATGHCGLMALPLTCSPYLYRARNLIERFFNKIRQCRRAATRYVKLAANYLAFVKLASIRIWLRANDSTR